MRLQKRYKVKVTKWGYFYILITILIGLGAANTGNNLLYLLDAALLALMMISGLSSVLNLTGLAVEIHPPQDIFASQPAPFRIRLRRSRWPLPAVLVGVKALGQETRGLVVFPREEKEGVLWLTFPKRGKNHLDRAEVFSSFPLGFFTRSRTVYLNQDFLVYPRPIPTGLPWGKGELPGEGKPGTEKGQGDDILELRAYQEGDPLKRVDWKATARKGELIVREMANIQGDRVIIQVSPGEGEWERVLGEATHLVLESARRGLAVGLVLPTETFPPARGEAHMRTLLRALALA